jgi:WD40 repeat protein
MSCLWDVASGREVDTVVVPLSPIAPNGVSAAGAAFSRDGTILAIADSNCDTYLWDVATRRTLAVLTGPHAADPDSTTFVASVAFSPDGKTLADPPGGSESDGSGTAKALAFSPDGRFLATDVDCGRGVYLWDVAHPKKPATVIGPGFDAFATPAVFSPDGAMVANFNGATRVWRVS